MYIFCNILSRLPLTILYICSDILYLVNKYFLRRRYKVVYRNLKTAFPDIKNDEINKLANVFFKNYYDVCIESFKSLSISQNELRNRVTVSNMTTVHKELYNNKNVVVLAAHICNWEWLLQACCIESHFDIDVVYKNNKSSLINTILKKIKLLLKEPAPG